MPTSITTYSDPVASGFRRGDYLVEFPGVSRSVIGSKHTPDVFSPPSTKRILKIDGKTITTRAAWSWPIAEWSRRMIEDFGWWIEREARSIAQRIGRR